MLMVVRVHLKWKLFATLKHVLYGQSGLSGLVVGLYFLIAIACFELLCFSKTCDGGSQRRDRACVLPKERSAIECIGADSEERMCNENACPIWTEWTDWTPCTRTCGGGIQSKLRECTLARNGGSSLFCEGEAVLNIECNTQDCPSWGSWGEWTSCTKSCGGGSRTKIRECLLLSGAQDSSSCLGVKENTEVCNPETCPDWTDWTEWTPCTASCGGGVRKRRRDCVEVRNTESKCVGDYEEIEDCGIEECPAFSEWSSWSDCSKSCGGGVRDRERHCQVPQ